MTPTQEQLEILKHTIGVCERVRVPYRNRYLAGPGHHSEHDLEALVAGGLMIKRKAPAFCDPTDVLYMATEAGQEAAMNGLPPEPPPPKRNRYHEWLDADCGHSFADFICVKNPPRFEFDLSGPRRRYRMVRYDYGGPNDVQGEWAPTKKAAKASYKTALKRHNQPAHQRTKEASK